MTHELLLVLLPPSWATACWMWQAGVPVALLVGLPWNLQHCHCQWQAPVQGLALAGLLPGLQEVQVLVWQAPGPGLAAVTGAGCCGRYQASLHLHSV